MVICDMREKNEGNESLVKMFNSHFLTPLSHNFKMLRCVSMQTPLQLDIWLQSYDKFVNAKNNIDFFLAYCDVKHDVFIIGYLIVLSLKSKFYMLAVYIH